MKALKITFATVVILLTFSFNCAFSGPIISGISTNEINIDTKFHGTKILLFGAKDDSGNIIVTIRGPKKNFILTKKEKLLGIWHNGKRISFKDLYSYYSVFYDINDENFNHEILSQFEIGRDNLDFTKSDDEDNKFEEFKIEFLRNLESQKLYSEYKKDVDFLNETLFKLLIDFPKNISRGVYTVEIYLIDDSGLASFQSIPIYVNQVGFSAKVLDFADQQSFLYGIACVLLAIFFGWLVNYLSRHFISK